MTFIYFKEYLKCKNPLNVKNSIQNLSSGFRYYSVDSINKNKKYSLQSLKFV